ncbi:uncharacterized protein MYCFIDRAFT_101876, partial [Pseudocercospora fijiensis CIRAD86]
LHVAAYNNHADVVETLIRARANIEAGHGNVGTALHFAALRGHCNVMSRLIERGACVNAISEKYGPVINAAILSGTVDAVKQIMNAEGIRVNVTGGSDKSTPLINAATRMPTECVELLLKENADINAKNTAGDTALIMAALKGNETCVRVLCQQGADVTHQSPRYGLAIQAAAQG